MINNHMFYLEREKMTAEGILAISPLIVYIFLVIGVIGLIIWKFLFKK
ncbi:unnamed protein product [Commensalibacter communis]|nr:unnamed protein product [Commensalibacter communis]CAI3948118.1 unnamed protein product [Commensalibacter communis]CAI3948361.1 unnamed protein product [Commensalibacter communis]